MAQRKVKRYRPSWERQKMVWDPFGMWVRYVAPDTKEIAPSASPNYRKGKTVRSLNGWRPYSDCVLDCSGKYIRGNCIDCPTYRRTASPVA
jgi:hypothetical protein